MLQRLRDITYIWSQHSTFHVGINERQVSSPYAQLFLPKTLMSLFFSSHAPLPPPSDPREELEFVEPCFGLFPTQVHFFGCPCWIRPWLSFVDPHASGPLLPALLTWRSLIGCRLSLWSLPGTHCWDQTLSCEPILAYRGFKTVYLPF